METLRLIVVLVHLIGFAVLLGSWAAQAFGGKRQITRIMNYGLALAGITGLALAAPWGVDDPMNYGKIGVKLGVIVVVGALLGIGSSRQRKGGSVPSAIFWLIGILTVANAAIAVLWR